MRDLHAGDAARSPRLATEAGTPGRGCRAGGPRRQSVPVYGLHEDYRRGPVMREVRYLRPESLAEAVQWYRTTPGCRPLAGGTDLMVMLHARTVRPEPQAVLDLWSLAELKGVRRVKDMVEIGAAESYTGMIASREVQEHLPALAAAARTIGAAQIQNRGTLGGNLANASPAGDTLPVLLAYDAVVATDRRSIPIDQLVGLQRGLPISGEELIDRNGAPIGRDDGVIREQHRECIPRGRRVREVAAERAAVLDLRRADRAGRSGKRGQMLLHLPGRNHPRV